MTEITLESIHAEIQEMKKAMKARQRLKEIRTDEVSLVDTPANGKKFLVFKNMPNTDEGGDNMSNVDIQTSEGLKSLDASLGDSNQGETTSVLKKIDDMEVSINKQVGDINKSIEKILHPEKPAEPPAPAPTPVPVSKTSDERIDTIEKALATMATGMNNIAKLLEDRKSLIKGLPPDDTPRPQTPEPTEQPLAKLMSDPQFRRFATHANAQNPMEMWNQLMQNQGKE